MQTFLLLLSNCNYSKLFLTFITMAVMAVSTAGYATQSTKVGPMQGLIPNTYQSYVDTAHCTQPIKSSPIAIVLGNGGANIALSCPSNYPVMYGWQEHIGYGGIGAVSSGGGNDYIVCCMVGYRWEPQK